MKKVITAILIIVIVAVGTGAYAYHYISGIDAPYDASDDSSRSVTIEQGATTKDIAGILESEGIIGSARKFIIFSRLNEYDGKFQAGTYFLSPSMTLREIADTLSNGDTVTLKFTIPEGYTLAKISEKLSESGIIDKSKFDALIAQGDFNYDFLKTAVQDGRKLEGYLFPDTYALPAGSDERAIINAMLSRFGEVFNDEYKSKTELLGMSVNEIITVASIIECEASVESDRPIVASVIYNRLRTGMTLGMDSTIHYILNNAEGELTYDDLAIESPYNTYVNQGLPPGPISCPGESAIKAALYPSDTDYLYFVLSDKGDGTMAFSEDYETFLKDKEAYYASIQ